VTSNSVVDGLSNRDFSICHLVTASTHNDNLVVFTDDPNDQPKCVVVYHQRTYDMILKAKIRRPNCAVKMEKSRGPRMDTLRHSCSTINSGRMAVFEGDVVGVDRFNHISLENCQV